MGEVQHPCPAPVSRLGFLSPWFWSSLTPIVNFCAPAYCRRHHLLNSKSYFNDQHSVTKMSFCPKTALSRIFGVFICLCTPVLSRVWPFEIPWPVSCQAPLSVDISRQEFWSGFPFATPGNHAKLVIVVVSHATPGSCVFYHWSTWEAPRILL